MGLKSAAQNLAGLSSAAAVIAVAGRTGVWIVCGLIALGFSLIATLALTGTFGSERSREAAQTVLAILLGRDQPRGVTSTRRKPTAGSACPPGSRRLHS